MATSTTVAGLRRGVLGAVGVDHNCLMTRCLQVGGAAITSLRHSSLGAVSIDHNRFLTRRVRRVPVTPADTSGSWRGLRRCPEGGGTARLVLAILDQSA